jgi:hypothetical protein
MSETFWKGEPVENLHREVLVEIARQQHFRIEALEAALRYYADPNNYSGYGMYELARAALAQEQDE